MYKPLQYFHPKMCLTVHRLRDNIDLSQATFLKQDLFYFLNTSYFGAIRPLKNLLLKIQTKLHKGSEVGYLEERERREGERRETDEDLRKERIGRLNVEDDLLYGEVVKDKLACQDMLRIILGKPNLKVEKSSPQYVVRNAFNRSVFLDVLATETGRSYQENDLARNYFNIEMQKLDDDDHLKRARYHQGAVDTNTFDKGTKFRELSDLYIVFITKNDFLSLGKPVGEVRRSIKNTDIDADNGVYEVYANTKTHPNAGGTAYDLLQYIKDTTKGRERDEFSNLVKRVNYLKYDEKGVEKMSSLLKLEREEGREEGRVEMILNTLSDLGEIPNTLKDDICHECDLERLKRLNKLAVLSKSIEEFSEEIIRM